MDARKSHFMGLIWASIVIVVFTIAATIVIVTWSPLVPEAIAVDMNHANDISTQKNSSKVFSAFAPYIALHQTESWHYTAALHQTIAIADCPD